MIPFLQKVAQQIIENHRDHLNKVCVILPNRRSILYLKKYFCDIIEQPTWSPKIWSIDDFVFEATHLSSCDQLELLFDLFAIHQNIAQKDARNFDDFVQWGVMILNDFDQIDAHLVDPDRLFGHLSEAKAIEVWNPDGTPLTEHERNYLAFYQSLSQYYHLLREKVVNENKAWNRLAFRLLCEKFDEYFKPYEPMLFYIVGFNALTLGEQTLFQQIARTTDTKIIWDFDPYYTTSTQHEAGHFLRKNFETFGKSEPTSDGFSQPKTLYIKPIAKNFGQAIAAGKILQKLSPEELAETAVILNDESLLLPLLSFLPDRCDHFNITMGYSLQQTQLYEFFIHWLTMHTTESKNEQRFYHKELFDFLQHPLFKKYIDRHYPDSWSILEQRIFDYRQNARPFLDLDIIRTHIFLPETEIFDTIEPLFVPWNDQLVTALNGWQLLLSLIEQSIDDEEDNVNKELVFVLQQKLRVMQKMVARYPDMLTGLRSISFIFRQILSNIAVPFAGEPLGGLQIMGMLESRLLDFKRIIMLSVNEGVLPAASSQKTFIPYDIRRQFHLPTEYEQSAIMAYHFYRTLQRCEEVYLLYNNAESSGVGSKEKSRFITQLEFELPHYQPNSVIITEEEATQNLSIYPIVPPVILMNETIKQDLKNIAEKGFSPSSISTYFRCSLKFYYSKILQVCVPDEMMEQVDSMLMGSIIHRAIEKLHQPLLRKPLTEEGLKHAIDHHSSAVERAFGELWKGGDYHTGKNHLTYLVAEYRVKQFLHRELERVAAGKEMVVLKQEHQLSRVFQVALDDGGVQEVRIKGTIDRICIEDGVYKIVDFKTGIVSSNDLIINLSKDDSGEINYSSYSDKALQLLIYAWLYLKDVEQNERDFDRSVMAEIIGLRDISKDYVLKYKEKKEGRGEEKSKKKDEKPLIIHASNLPLIESLLQAIFREIFNSEGVFDATEEKKDCRNCDFARCCGRGFSG